MSMRHYDKPIEIPELHRKVNHEYLECYEKLSMLEIYLHREKLITLSKFKDSNMDETKREKLEEDILYIETEEKRIQETLKYLSDTEAISWAWSSHYLNCVLGSYEKKLYKTEDIDLRGLTTPVKNINKKKQDAQSKIFLIPLILIIFFVLSIFDMPYSFYQIMRIVVCIMSAVFAFLHCVYSNKFSFSSLSAIAIAILWNPVFPIYLNDRDLWISLDVLAIIPETIMLISSYKLWKRI